MMFRPVLACWLGFALCGLMWSAAYAATRLDVGGAYPTKVSKDDQIVLEQVVCAYGSGTPAARINGWSLERENGKLQYVDVACRPHRMSKKDTVYKVAQCARESGKWSCSQGEDEILVNLRDRAVALRPNKVKDEVATHALRTIGTAGYFQGQSLVDAIQSPCYMALGPTKDLLEMSCATWTVMITHWCPSKSENCPRIIYMNERKD
jgi:hypothetical protein